MVVEKLPFIETALSNNKFIRDFSIANHNELVWHRDKEDRLIMSIEYTDWSIQLDNDIPEIIKVDIPFLIKAGVYHRLVPGKLKPPKILVEKLF